MVVLNLQSTQDLQILKTFNILDLKKVHNIRT